MSWQATSWAARRRYDDPLARFVMLTLADTAGMGGGQEVSLAGLSDRTEIDEDDLVAILQRLAIRGHIAAFSVEGDVLRVSTPFEAEDISATPRPKCPQDLRRRVIEEFHHQCSYCLGFGSYTDGPDGKPWHVDRIDAGRMYEAGNVTLACATCNVAKGNRPARTPVKSLYDLFKERRR